MPPKPPRVGVVLLNFNSAEDTLACLESLRDSEGGERRVWVADNASADASATLIPKALRDDEAWLPTGANLGYAGGNNAGIREALNWGADYVLILNPDCTVDKGFLRHLLRALEAQPRAGIACSKILDRETGWVQSVGGEASLWTGRCRRRHYRMKDGEAGTNEWSRVDFPSGACMLIRRECLEEIGLLNESYFLYYEDVEIGFRARREGWEVLAIPHSRVFHADTTSERFGNPAVVYYGTRNQAWLAREYGRPWHVVSFFLLCLVFRWPFRLLSRLLTGNFRASWAVLRGAWAGAFGRGWTTGRHLAVPVQGRKRLPLAPG